jgi:hypothetical protein
MCVNLKAQPTLNLGPHGHPLPSSNRLKLCHGRTWSDGVRGGPITRGTQRRIERRGSVLVFHTPLAQQSICYSSRGYAREGSILHTVACKNRGLLLIMERQNSPGPDGRYSFGTPRALRITQRDFNFYGTCCIGTPSSMSSTC